MYHYVLAISAIVSMMIIWGLVQMLWLRMFPEYGTDVDALAVREDCHGCDHGGDCSIKHSDSCSTSGFEV